MHSNNLTPLNIHASTYWKQSVFSCSLHIRKLLLCLSTFNQRVCSHILRIDRLYKHVAGLLAYKQIYIFFWVTYIFFWVKIWAAVVTPKDFEILLQSFYCTQIVTKNT